jgi:hypothetical protein
MNLVMLSRGVERIHFKGTDQPLLRDGVETFRASTVITEPYVMADKNKFSTRAPTSEMMNSLRTRRRQRTTLIEWSRPIG